MDKTTHAITTMPSCLKCRFCDTVTNAMQGQTVYLCRLKPPTAFAMPGMTRPGELQWMNGTFWPQVAASDWCGEHQGRFDS
jgi:hypothetical protein